MHVIIETITHMRTHTHSHSHSITSETAGKHFLPEWDLSQSSDEFDLNIEGEDQTLQHVPIEDWGCTLSDDNN